MNKSIAKSNVKMNPGTNQIIVFFETNDNNMINYKFQ